MNADKIVAISENTKKDIIKFYGIDPTKIEVVYQSVDPLYFEQTTDEVEHKVFKQNKIPADYFLYVGSVQERKNLKLIVDAYNQLVNESAVAGEFKVPLVIVGKGKKYKDEVIQLIQDYKLENLVIWLDKLDDNYALKALYHKAKALIYPSYYEGFGLPIAEALLCKTPVITSGVSCLPEAGGPNSLYIDPRSHQELAGAITKVLTDKKMVAAMKEKGYQYACERFSAKTVSEHMMKVYQDLIS